MLQANITKVMKGTEVPNPRRSSACDYTYVLTRILSRDSLMLVMRLPMQSSLTNFDALSQALCNSSLAFLADLILSDPFHTAFSCKLHSAFHLDRKT